MFSLGLLALLLAASTGHAEVLQLKARGRFYLAQGWTLAYWGLEDARGGVALHLEAERSPCLPERACVVTRRLRLPDTIRREGPALTFTDAAGRRHVLAVRRDGEYHLGEGIDVRWDRAGTFLLIDTDASLPHL
jgi:hypothetical protein